MSQDHTALDTDDVGTVVAPGNKQRPTRVIVAIAACTVVLLGAVAGTILTVNTPRAAAPATAVASTETTPTKSEAPVKTAKPAPVKTPAKTRAAACLESGEVVKCTDGLDQGPPIPESLRGQPYVCQVDNRPKCYSIWAADPSTGKCTEFDYIAPRAPGTENGWRQNDDYDDDSAWYICENL